MTGLSGDGAKGESLRGRTRALGRWITRHPVRAVLIALLIYLVVELLTIPYLSIWNLDTKNPGETALMRQRIREAEQKGEALAIRQRWISVSRVPRHVLDAIVVAEDGTFFSHGGVDWFEVRESIRKNVNQRRVVRGASTITQQLAKNLYLSTSRTPLRKLKELIITMMLESRLSKERILELYLNVIEWGRGVFGLEAASQAYFGKSVGSLTLEESARLAAVIPSPLRYRPDQDSRYVLRRKEIVLQRLQARNRTVNVPQEETTSSRTMEEVPRDDRELPEDSLDQNEDNE